MRTLVIGAGGLVGSNVVWEAMARGWPVAGTYRSEPPGFEVPLSRLDVRDADRVAAVVDRADPEAVVNCAAMTDVDGCERDRERARAVNADAPATLAEACRERGVAFVHLSTDYVFGGRAGAPYDESATPDPRQMYGQSKLAGEHAVERHHDAPLVVRLSFVYGVHHGRPESALTGFPAWVRSRLRENEPVPLYTDQRVTPTRAAQAAETVLDLVREGADGTYHVACRSCVTPYEFGDAVRERLGAPADFLDRVSLDDADRPAARPRETCLAVDRIESYLGRRQPSLADDLDTLEPWLHEA